MAPSFDFAASILLCAEDNTAILDLGEESEEISWVVGVDASLGDLSMDFPLQSDDCIEALLGREEQQHIPMEGYLQRLLLQPDELDLVAVRSDAIDWIWKVHELYKFGPLTAVLSVNYLDRFLSVFDLPVCDAKYVFETRTIKRMELAVLNALKWRMQAVTACSFIDYYLHKFNDDDTPSTSALSRSVDLILSTCKVAEFLVFRPSEIAASVALVALEEHETSMFERVATCYKNLKKERVLRCYEMIQDKIIMRNIMRQSAGSVFSIPKSPIGVLDAAACISQQSEDTFVGSPATNYESSASSKRRRICR
uniref:Cyclin C-terminal domain-containing protein n=1 Tax=Oryza nivara TaxID=4536 RepID=A0A0E0HMQ9_ORYNI